MFKRTIAFSLILIIIYGFHYLPIENALNLAISEYSKKTQTLKKHVYSEIIIDSITYYDYYLFQFFPSNQRKFLIEEDKYFPNCMDSINNHKIIWHNASCSNKDNVIKELNKLEMIDSFYVRDRSPKNNIQEIDNINYPIYVIDEKMTPYYVVISKMDLRITVKSFNVKCLDKLLVHDKKRTIN